MKRLLYFDKSMTICKMTLFKVECLHVVDTCSLIVGLQPSVMNKFFMTALKSIWALLIVNVINTL